LKPQFKFPAVNALYRLDQTIKVSNILASRNHGSITGGIV